MVRSEDQNRLARERSRESILLAAIDAFAERGVAGASIAEITARAGVSQGLVNYHFGGKAQLIGAVIDRWFATMLNLAEPGDTPDATLAAIIDGALSATVYAMPLQRAVLGMQQQPATHRLFAESEERHADATTAGEDAVRALFRARGAADPALEEIMLRSTLEGVFMKYAVYGDTYPLEDARRWVHRLYGLPEPTSPLAPDAPPRAADPRPRAGGALREPSET
ncbi:TetR/AcrR family transcriptional regulator [Microbacterium sp. 179-I 3D4 NHS]|uniref:TetR/AcrR family transcriptional regulator n=1 Tax=Microbacterium sp. 179-I 3D4 NHS TaxID=3142381 RepID=UPI0039A32361